MDNSSNYISRFNSCFNKCHVEKLANTSKELLLQILPSHSLKQWYILNLQSVHALCKWEWMLLDGQTSCKHTIEANIQEGKSLWLPHGVLPTRSSCLNSHPTAAGHKALWSVHHIPWAPGTWNSPTSPGSLIYGGWQPFCSLLLKYSQEAKHLSEHVLH